MFDRIGAILTGTFIAATPANDSSDSMTMTANNELLKLVIELDCALQSRDDELIEKVAYRIPRDVLLGEDLLETARVYRQGPVVKFLATLIACNSGHNESLNLLLESYKSIGALAMTDPIIAMRPDSPVRMAIESIITAKPIPQDRAKRRARKTSNEERELAITLLIEHDRYADAERLFTRIAFSDANLREFLTIAKKALMRIKHDVSLVPDDWQSKANFAECLHRIASQLGQTTLLSNLAMVVVECHMKAQRFEDAITWTRRAKAPEDQAKAFYQRACAHCHQGDYAQTAAALDSALSLMTVNRFDWSKKTASAWGETKESGEFNVDGASQALADLNADLGEIGIRPFIVSGTLLGYARNGALLPHDKDVDVGIFGWEAQFDIAAGLLKSRKFRVSTRNLLGQRAYCVPVIHTASGITIDIFFYQAEGDKLVTGVNHDFGYVQEFEFSRFDLQKIAFLGTEFYAPDDIDRNLAENFGNWRIPDKNYISHLESPSTRDVGGDVYMIVARTSLLSALIAKNFEKAARAFAIAARHAHCAGRLPPALMDQLQESCGFSASIPIAVEA